MYFWRVYAIAFNNYEIAYNKKTYIFSTKNWLEVICSNKTQV